MEKTSQASIEICVQWRSAQAVHRDRNFFHKVSFWRDFFRGDLGERLSRAEEGAAVTESFPEGDLVPPRRPANLHRIKESQLRRRLGGGRELDPRPGRFHPRGLVEGIAGNFPEDRRPFRFLGSEGPLCHVDFNHPMAAFPVTVEARLVERLNEREERGGRCNDIPLEVTDNGPGLQASLPDRETDFFAGDPFARADSADDALFYAQPRLVNHIDAVAMAHVRQIYGRILRPGSKVLDLMSSWSSHLPEEIPDLAVTGLGMNEEELRANERLSAHCVHDLNREPVLPFTDQSFDAAVCTVSVEYLTDPSTVFREVGRVLRPGAPFVVTFSDRWFPPKVVRIWIELHPFERVGLVLEYFRKAGTFADLASESVRGHLRPADDKYARLTPMADPLYAVWGRRKTH